VSLLFLNILWTFSIISFVFRLTPASNRENNVEKLLILTISLNNIGYANILGMPVQKEQVSLALSKDLIKLIDKRRGRASRSAEVEYLIKLGLEHEEEREVNEPKC